jgi:signal peptidase I
MDNERKSKSGNEAMEWIEAIVIAFVAAFLIRYFIFEPITVEGSSMVPTLHDGDMLIVDKISYRFNEPQRGDIVIFKYPGDVKENFVKRIIALGGDEIEVKNGDVYVNGQRLLEDYIAAQPQVGFDDSIVPEGTIFVLGDNRNGSKDSRDPQVGFVPVDNIVGKAVLRIWPVNRMGALDTTYRFANGAASASEGE